MINKQGRGIACIPDQIHDHYNNNNYLNKQYTKELYTLHYLTDAVAIVNAYLV